MNTEGGGRLAPDGTLRENDHDSALGDKDVLPAYDGAGGPPMYFEFNVRACEGVGTFETMAGEECPGAGVQVQVQVHDPSAIVAEAEFTTLEPGHTRPIPVYDCNDPASMGVEDLYGRPLPPPVDVRAESGTVGSDAPLILMHADSAVDSPSPPPPPAMTTSRRDAPLPPTPS